MLHVGDRAPAFTLKDDAGRAVSLKEFRGQTVILYFYPKDDTPGCTKEACGFRDQYPTFQAQGAVILGVSRDDTDSHHRFRDKYQLPFPLLADETGTVTKAYGVWVKKAMYGRSYFGIERTTFIINGKGMMTEIIRKVKVNGHAEALLATLPRTT